MPTDEKDLDFNKKEGIHFLIYLLSTEQVTGRELFYYMKKYDQKAVIHRYSSWAVCGGGGVGYRLQQHKQTECMDKGLYEIKLNNNTNYTLITIPIKCTVFNFFKTIFKKT